MTRSTESSRLYRVAFRMTGMPSLPEGTNCISREFSWLEQAAGHVQFVSLYDRDEFDTPVAEGIRIVLDVVADSPEDAVSAAELAADSIGRIISFQAGAAHSPPKVVALLDVTPGLTRRIYRQWCYDALAASPSRRVLIYEIETTACSLGRRRETDRDAIMRGLKWYTDALNERDTVDRFLKAWVGLESIGVIINRRAHKSGWDNCVKCLGDRDKRAKDEKQERGIRHIFSVREPSKPDLFDHLKRARNKLVHAEWTLSRVRCDIDARVDLMVKMLASGLLTAIAPPGVSAGSRVAFEPAPLAGRSADVAVSVELLTSNPDIWGELNEKLEVVAQLTASQEIDGQYKARVVFKIGMVCPCKFENLTVTPERTPEDGVEITVDEEPALVEVQEVRANEGLPSNRVTKKA